LIDLQIKSCIKDRKGADLGNGIDLKPYISELTTKEVTTINKKAKD